MKGRVIKFLVVVIFLLTSDAMAAKNPLKQDGVKITYENEYGEESTIAIKRVHDDACRDKKKINGMLPSHVWGGDYAKSSVPNACKKTFVTTVGMISPVKIADGVETYAELEVIEFMKKASSDKSMLFIDARLADWFMQKTIPTAVNIPFKNFDPVKKPLMFEEVADAIGISIEDGKYNFSEAKTLLLFCNGAWCPQSTWAIENLIKIGYPKEKLKWYRGGITGWTMLGLTTVVPK